MLFRLLLLATLHQCVTSYPHYQKNIPNGAQVPFPCKPGQTWQGVGHFIDGGGPQLNQFGLDFKAANHTWTVDLCKKDSDGDGRTNGEELGDPDCVWKENSTPNTTEGLSHPGICDPWDSPTCLKKPVNHPTYKTQGEWLTDMCKKGLDCPAMNEPGVLNLTVRIPPTPIPAKETTYECQIFDIYSLGLARNQSFHMIAVTPILNNRNVLHHMVLSGCVDGTPSSPGPFECGMIASEKCQQFLHVWTVGLDGACYHPQSGIRIGLNGYKVVAIQLHWNNPGQSTNLTDSSGLLLHYTPKLRLFDAGILTIGSNFFYLPPKKEEVIVHSTCGSGCTQHNLVGEVNITSAWNHMHYAGRKMSIEVKRNNNHVTYLTDDKEYHYDSPEVHLFPSPFVLLPGDELVTTCGFSTISKNKTIFSGEGTSDEMCYGFITYYPVQNITEPFCTDRLGVSSCDQASWGDCKNLDKFINELPNTTVYQEVLKNCQVITPCLTECQETLKNYVDKEPCMKGNVWEYVQNRLLQFSSGQNFLSRLSSCPTQADQPLNPPPKTVCNTKDNSALGIGAAWSLVLLTLVVVVLQMLI